MMNREAARKYLGIAVKIKENGITFYTAHHASKVGKIIEAVLVMEGTVVHIDKRRIRRRGRYRYRTVYYIHVVE
jgi:hypothetical protein